MLRLNELSQHIDEYLKRQDEVKSLAGLAVYLKTDQEALRELLDGKGPKARLIGYAMDCIEKELIENALKGKYNATMASFLLKSGYGRERHDDAPQPTGVKIELADELGRLAR
ncbi:MAG: terminase small subunit [Clostridia bacterium]|nr:terminase small subunit [Clostridia bacterium]